MSLQVYYKLKGENVTIFQKIISNVDNPILVKGHYYRKRILSSGYDKFILTTSSKFEESFRKIDTISEYEFNNIKDYN